MDSLAEDLIEYKKQLKTGKINRAYKGLMEYILSLRTHLKNKYPDYCGSGNLYQGYMDMTYFSFFPKTIEVRDLKIAIVFLHAPFRFEVWLAGRNKQIQTKYWNIFSENKWNLYNIVATTKGADSIIEFVLVDNPDFSDLIALTSQIENKILKFINDIDNFLSALST
ncbi:MAG: hypothetical protein WCK35_29235 [Chloroflexota bacterium]